MIKNNDILNSAELSEKDYHSLWSNTTFYPLRVHIYVYVKEEIQQGTGLTKANYF